MSAEKCNGVCSYCPFGIAETMGCKKKVEQVASVDKQWAEKVKDDVVYEA